MLAEERLEEAFIAVKDAEMAGAKEEVVELVHKLNEALLLIERAKKEDGTTLASSSIEVSESIISKAKELEILASERFFKLKMVLMASVPTASVLVAFSLNYLYKWWRRREIERILRMIARKKGERHD